jgi:hypothetical protein
MRNGNSLLGDLTVMATHGFGIGKTNQTQHFVCVIELQGFANHIKISIVAQKFFYSKLMSTVTVKHS